MIGFAFQFESQESYFYWKNLYLLVQAEIFNLNYNTNLKIFPTIRTLLKISCSQKKKGTIISKSFKTFHLFKPIKWDLWWRKERQIAKDKKSMGPKHWRCKLKWPHIHIGIYMSMITNRHTWEPTIQVPLCNKNNYHSSLQKYNTIFLSFPLKVNFHLFSFPLLYRN